MSDVKETTILLVEDEEAHARLIERNLKRAGLRNRLLWVDGGQKALDLLYGADGTGNPDRPDPILLLLDLNMPGVNGYQVLKTLKSHDELHKVPVIILTTTDDQREIDHAYDMGANAYITKPVELTDFIKTISELGLFLQIVHSPYLG